MNLCQKFGWTLEELVEHKDDIIHYSDCYDMSDVAYYLVNEAGMLDGVSDHISRYFDYDAFGRDLEIGGTYVCTNRGIYEIPY